MAATLLLSAVVLRATGDGGLGDLRRRPAVGLAGVDDPHEDRPALGVTEVEGGGARRDALAGGHGLAPVGEVARIRSSDVDLGAPTASSAEHTSELQSLMRISYAV